MMQLHSKPKQKHISSTLQVKAIPTNFLRLKHHESIIMTNISILTPQMNFLCTDKPICHLSIQTLFTTPSNGPPSPLVPNIHHHQHIHMCKCHHLLTITSFQFIKFCMSYTKQCNQLPLSNRTNTHFLHVLCLNSYS